MYVFHGTDDEVVPYSQSKKLLESAKKNPDSIITTLKDGHHKGLEKFKEYQAKLDEILK
jgi:fermentation-respiration switch protein FrsA (DUF1100 family)